MVEKPKRPEFRPIPPLVRWQRPSTVPEKGKPLEKPEFDLRRALQRAGGNSIGLTSPEHFYTLGRSPPGPRPKKK